MSEARDGFLSRWSRLKREGEPAPRTEAGSASVSAPSSEEVSLPDGKPLEELIAELPRVEDLVPGQNLAVFMQAWVPDALRNAALQRMWLLDPAIRDYVSPALDYAHDYNTPGGAPGFGTIETTQEMVREVSEMFDRALLRGRPADSCGTAGDDDGNLSQGDEDEPGNDAAAQRERIIRKSDGPAGNRLPQQPIAQLPAPDVAQPDRAATAPHNTPADETLARPPGRRHGSALPG
ncbi:DUF3306 domain-containing protein [Bosea caraganae]|uniref:DUF3306 domain-containing protein n=1 Tax=Bosea caraganae TaxID=2763117 RepID=UPI0015F0091A|nr:DUF3306 domain-containing protein [Bosea caraganae]